MAKLRRDVLPLTSSSFCQSSSSNNDSQVRFFAGHTRFATSSRANFDGTHPHSWSPPTSYRFYNINKRTSSVDYNPCSTPTNIVVENFISHNGGKVLSYELKLFWFEERSTYLTCILLMYSRYFGRL